MENDHFNIKAHRTNKVIKKITYSNINQITLKRLNKPIIRGWFSDERLESGYVTIGDKFLRKFITPQVSNKSNRHKVMCGCEICIFSYVIQCE